jgi:Resolvase, N terminal domain
VQQSSGTSPAAQMRLQMQGVFAAYEWALIRERTRRGRLFAARQGRVHWGPPLWLHVCAEDGHHAAASGDQRGRSRDGPADLSLLCEGADEFLWGDLKRRCVCPHGRIDIPRPHHYISILSPHLCG